MANGRIEITAEGGAADLIYSVDAGATWQESSIFTNLSGGIYNVRVANVDESCIDIYPTITLTDPTGGTINNVVAGNNGCASGSGTITIEATSETALEYSLDGGATWQSSNNFINLADGSYMVAIRNVNDNCLVEYIGNPVVINTVGFAINTVQAAEPSTCGAEDGGISIGTTGGNLTYSINGGVNYFPNADFNDLPAGTYNIFVRDEDTGCEQAYVFNPVELIDGEQPTISNVEITSPSDCNANDAVITIVANGEGGLQYSLDGSTWSNGNSFINLLPGLYNVWVRNIDESCAVPYANNPVVITAPTGPIITECIGSNPTDCNVNDGSLTILATCLLYTSPSPRDRTRSRMPSSA